MEKNCNWDYPDWEEEQEFINSERVPVPAEICGWCDYLDACRMRVALLMNLWIETSDERLEEIRKLIIEETNSANQKTIH